MKTTILVIEDHEDVRENIADILRISGYDVLTAPNGKIGIELAYKQKPHLVLCDIMMPELDGYSVLHILSKHPITANTPFIFLTAKSEKTDFRKGMNMGADDYLVKPFDGMDLLEVVDVRLKKNESMKTCFDNHMEGTDECFGNRPRRSYKKGDHIFMESQRPGELYYIIRGEVKTCRLNSDGKELVTGMYREGQFIGYISLLENTTYTESAVVLKDTELGVISKHDFQTLIHTNRQVASRFIKILSNNLFETEKRLLELAYQSVRQRVASALVYFFHQQRVAEKSIPLMTVTRKDIANFVGTALESLNRTLADFRDERLIALTDGGIKIMAMEKLEKLSR